MAVANVIINRTKSALFPSTICEVVKQRTKYSCQFSWVCKIRPENVFVRDPAVHDVADKVLTKGVVDNTNGALFFHNLSDRPAWTNNLRKTTVIGNHVFYRRNSHE